MAKRKINKEVQGSEDIIKDLTIESTGNNEPEINSEVILESKDEIKEDNPFSKKVTAEIDKIIHNKNNEILNDSDLIGNIIL